MAERPCWAVWILLFLIVVLQSLAVVEGYKSKRLSDTIRVFYGAPRGYVVYVVRRQMFADVSTPGRVHQYAMTGPDRAFFHLSDNVIKVDEYPRLTKPIGAAYSVSVQITSVDSAGSELVAILDLQIVVSEKNRHAPQFTSGGATKIEVFRYSAPGRRIGQIEARDDDVEAYNRHVTYTLDRAHLKPVAIDAETGVITAKNTLRDAPSMFQVEVIATDDGSPQMSASVNLTLLVRDISEPMNVSVQIQNTTAARICWQKPRYGRCTKYELILGSTEYADSRRSVIQRVSTPLVCTQLTDLRSFEENWIQIRGLNGHLKGVPVKMFFHVEKNFCADRPCGVGTCLQTSEPQGYRCLCPDGHSGYSCKHLMACTSQECQIADGDAAGELCDCSLAGSARSKFCRERCTGQPLSCENGGTLATRRGKATCICPKGYYGDDCKLYDPCTSALCRNGGTCRNISSTQFRCQCPRGYFGETCQHFDLCSLQPCRNGGYCKNVSDSEYYCYCYYGYYGENCSRYDPCASAPCQNNGVCKNVSDSSYVCKCQPGFYGYECELYNPCLEDPCLYGGMCNSIDGAIVCECVFGRFGPRCEHVNMCLFSDPCGEHAVTCHNITDAQYRCICEPGWSGENCTVFDPCFNSPCLHSGTCRRVGTLDYTCSCRSGYYGSNCEYLNHCISSPCKNAGTCRNVSANDFRCDCPKGYYGKRCEHFNPCSKGACLNNAICRNTSSTTYRCICSSFYFGELCQYYNTCAISPCKNGVCTMSPTGKYSCRCDPGYTGDHCEVFDPCLSEPCQNGGKCIGLPGGRHRCSCVDHFYGADCGRFDSCHSSPCRYGRCVNEPAGGYRCECPHGKFGDRCQSSDPCSSRPCANGGSCLSLDRKHFSCTCREGYYGERCEMRNPCLFNPCKHDSTCEHLGDNRYRCQCGIEFQGENCAEEIPCNAHGKRCYNDGKCKTFPNGTVYCDCPEGWFGFRCENYNPCSSTNACLNSGTCVVLENGMFTCHCQTGFFGDRCEYHEPCKQYICKNNGTCVHSTKGDLCYCKPGFLGKLCEIDIDECVSFPCNHEGTCIDLPGSYTCMCPQGYTGRECNDIEMCHSEELHTARGTFYWPSTAPDKEVILECSRLRGKYAYRKCVLDDNEKAVWQPANVKDCPMAVQSPEEAIYALQPFTNASAALRHAFEVAEAVKLLEITLSYSYNKEVVAAQMLTVIDELLDLPIQVLFESNSSERILNVLDRFMSNVHWLSRNITVTKRNFALEVRTVTWIEHDKGTYYSPKSAPGVEFFVPPETFQRDVSSERIKFIYFNNSKLFHRSTTIHDWTDVGDVISAKLGFDSIYDVKSCVHFIIPNKWVSPNNRCVFWDQKETSWNAWGVETLSYRGQRTKCCSSHLTSFAVVNSPLIAEVSHVEEDWYFNVFAHAGESVAIFCLSVVLLTYSIFRSLNKENFGQLLLQMTGSLLFMNFCVMIGSNRFHVNNDQVCCGIAILVHYFTLSSIMWSCVMGHHLTKVMETDFTRLNTVFLCKRCLIAWGVPLIPVAISAGIHMDGYRENTASCFLSDDNKYVFCSTYVIPGVCCIIVNSVIIGMLLKTLCVTSTTSHKAAPIPISQILGILAVQMLIGLSWIAAYISTISSLLDYSIYFIFIHFTLNGILGATVLFFHLVLRKEARGAWIQCCDKRRSYASSRRRVAGKGTVGARGAATSKSEGDYTLVIDRAGHREGCCPCPVEGRGDQAGGSRAGEPDVTATGSASNTVREMPRHAQQHARLSSDGSSSTHASYGLPSAAHSDAQRARCRGERPRTSSTSAYAPGSQQAAAHEASRPERTRDCYKTVECDRHQTLARRPSKSPRGQDGLVNTRV